MSDSIFKRHSDELINVDTRWAAPRESQSAGSFRPIILKSSTCKVCSIIGVGFVSARQSAAYRALRSHGDLVIRSPGTDGRAKATSTFPDISSR